MVKMNLTDNQTSFEYALYMIASSYFDKIKCKSTRLEENMLIKYKEQHLEKQYKMEDICIAYMERLSKKLPDDFFEPGTIVHLVKEHDGTTGILFLNKLYALELHGIYAGKKSAVDCVIKKKL